MVAGALVTVAGVPRAKRGDIWKLLARQYNINNKGLNTQAEERPPDMPGYKELLRGLTPHQHAILIDLGMTFIVCALTV